MNKAILISVLIALTFSFLIFYAFHEFFPPQRVSDIKEHSFFAENKNSDSEKILLLGGSGAVQLNSTMINQLLNKNYENHVFYNLAYNADTPKQRYNSIHETVMLKPKLVLYGITYVDFNGFLWLNAPKNIQPLPTIELNPAKLFSSHNDPFLEINPKETTLNFIRESFGDTGLFPKKADRFQLENSPFSFFDEYQTIIADDSDLKKIGSDLVKKVVKQDESVKKEQAGYLKEIIKSLQNNDAKVIIFILPQQKYFLDLVPEDDKAIFYAGVEEIKSELNVKIYDLSDDYASLNIWMDHNHVAYNKKSMIFSDDIYKIIIKEMS
jgi:hypothetical protein